MNLLLPLFEVLRKLLVRDHDDRVPGTVKIIVERARSFISPVVMYLLQLLHDALMPPGERSVTILLGLSLPIGRHNYCTIQVKHRDLGVRCGGEVHPV